MLGISLIISLLLKIKNENVKNRAIKILLAVIVIYIVIMLVSKIEFFRRRFIKISGIVYGIGNGRYKVFEG